MSRLIAPHATQTDGAFDPRSVRPKTAPVDVDALRPPFGVCPVTYALA